MTFTEKQEIAFNKMQEFFGGEVILGIHGISKTTNREYVVTPARRLEEPQEAWNRPSTLADLALCREANARGQDIFCRPIEDKEAYYVLIDDIPEIYINAEYDKPGRMLVASSTTGRQMWLKCNRPLIREEKLFIASSMYNGCDMYAAKAPTKRNGRMPGFFNKKPKYSPNFPVATIIWQTDGVYEVPEFSPEDLAPFKEIEKTTQPVKLSTSIKSKPNMPKRADYERGNESITDYCFCLALARRGVERDEIASMLHEQVTVNRRPSIIPYIFRLC